MKIAFVHYHLRRGGVTRVLESTLSAWAHGEVTPVVLTGEPEAGSGIAPALVRVVDGLGYDDADPACDPAVLADRLAAAAGSALGGEPDLWHIHNHALGKNVALPEALVRLARRGHRLLLHIHDFAEDGRPANYRHLVSHLGPRPALYPTAPGIHYALLTHRDRRFLLEAGSPPDRTHLLPNAIRMDQGEASETEPVSQRLFLYPTRAIRRKNLGEFLLWSALGQAGDRFAVSLAPENPAARPVYDRWVSFADELGLPVEFEAGLRWQKPFAALLRSATALATTAVAEGFGMAYLEPWLVDRPVVGRNLPEITTGFAEQGIELDGLYERLDCPVDWVGTAPLRNALAAQLRTLRAAYGRDTADKDVETALAAAVHGDRVDFGCLDEAMQRDVIRRLLGSPDEAARLTPSRLYPAPVPTQANRRLVERVYSPDAYGRALLDIYRGVANAPTAAPTFLNANSLIESFLDPTRFRLLRT